MTAGSYYLGVVSEGQSATNQYQVGFGASTFTLSSLGEAQVNYLGDVDTGDLFDTYSLAGGEVRLYQFSVPAGVQSIEARLENRTGNPTMVLKAGARTPDPGAPNGSLGLGLDAYGIEGGESSAYDVGTSLITIANPTNGLYTLAVKARGTGTTGPALVISNATYTLHLSATGTLPINFDQGSTLVLNQAPSTWRFFRVLVPTNASGWDIRLTGVTNGAPRLVVRRETLPNGVATTLWGQGQAGGYSYWPTNYQWAPIKDWTQRSLATDGVTSEDNRILAMGINKPLEPGTYYVGVSNASPVANTTYTLLSRGIGDGFAIALVDLPFVGSTTNWSLPARDAAYYRVVIPSNTPSWHLKLTGLVGESMLAVLRGALPNADTINPSASITSGKSMQKLGNEHFLLLPPANQTNLVAGTNFLAVIAEGKNPGVTNSTRYIGSGSSAYVLSSLGALPVRNLGWLTSEDLVQADSLEGGETKAYQFWVPQGTCGVKVHLENRVGNPVAVALAGERLPDPGAGANGQPADPYGNEGGQASADYQPIILTLPNPVPGLYSVMVKARQQGATFPDPSYPDASYTLRVQELLVPELNFSSDQNTNGLSNEVSGLLENNERAFFKVVIPATNNGQPVIGWKLDLEQSSGVAYMRAFRDALPSDTNTSTLMPFTTASAFLAPPYFTNGTWYVEVKGSNSTAFTLRNSPLTLERPAWSMPAPDQPSQTPGVALPLFGDTTIDTNGLALPGGTNNGIFLNQGSMHYYAVEVPATNFGLLRAQLDVVSGYPELYLRFGGVPTLSHGPLGAMAGGNPPGVYDRYLLGATNMGFANWVPLDGKFETQLKPGRWYLAVRAGGSSNARYNLRTSLANLADLPIQSPALTNQFVRGGDWLYYRVPMPTALPLTFNVTFSMDRGSVALYLRDTLPPGNGNNITISSPDVRDWSKDAKNFGPYPSFNSPGTYSLSAPAVRPGQILYLGFRAQSDSIISSVRVTTNGVPVQEPAVVPFYGGTASTNVPAFSAVVFRVDVPPEATRWKHVSLHPTNLVVYLDQGTLPSLGSGRGWKSPSATANSSYSMGLVYWDATSKQCLPNTNGWPWVPGQSYFLTVTNLTPAPQDFTLLMDGQNADTEDVDNDGLPDYWECYYFGSYTAQNGAADPDRDGVNNLLEYQQGTDPTNPKSYAAMLRTYATNGIVQCLPYSTNYALGSTVVLTAVPNPGYAFIGWSGDATGLANPLTVTVDTNKTVIANFKLAGDDFITPLWLSGSSVSVMASNVSFTKEPGEPNHAGNPGGKSIWWRWTAPASGPVTITTAGTPFTTLLAVYTGTNVASLSPIASDINSTGSTNRSVVNFTAAADTTYNIAVDGYNGASSRILLTLSTSALPPAVVPPLLTVPSVAPDGTVQFVLSAEGNHTYVIEYSDDLSSWTQHSVVTTSASGTVNIADPGAAKSNLRFYRAHLQ
ncbi:MAG TPA: pre-peptidase C-terminal domain-containing protein [Bacillota bacterium]|nr:pre-peptidase C-terminal domain-containing protein [Bacillota bacterium]